MKETRMFRTANVVALMAIGTFMYFATSAKSDYQPRAAHWDGTLVLKNDAGTSRPITLTLAGSLELCVSGLSTAASKVEKSNGYVWTNKDFSQFSFVEQPSIAYLKREVIEFKCVKETSSQSNG
jgi:hypothetical protein